MTLAVIDVVAAIAVAWGVTRFVPVEGWKKAAIFFGVLFLAAWFSVSTILNSKAWW